MIKPTENPFNHEILILQCIRLVLTYPFVTSALLKDPSFHGCNNKSLLDVATRTFKRMTLTDTF